MQATDTTTCDVLIIDDDDAIRDVLQMALDDEGYRVTTAANGRAALEYLRQTSVPPHLILLDLMMPIMNGWDFRSAQQQDAQLATIPVVILSADQSIQSKAASIHANGYLQKPIDIDLLIATVAEYCA